MGRTIVRGRGIDRRRGRRIRVEIGLREMLVVVREEGVPAGILGEIPEGVVRVGIRVEILEGTGRLGT